MSRIPYPSADVWMESQKYADQRRREELARQARIVDGFLPNYPFPNRKLLTVISSGRYMVGIDSGPPNIQHVGSENQQRRQKKLLLLT